jgi:hypothetical protein
MTVLHFAGWELSFDLVARAASFLYMGIATSARLA